MPLTTTTWAAFKSTGLLPRSSNPHFRGIGWPALSDLGHELVELSAAAQAAGGWKRSIDDETARVLVGGCHAGYPVTLTWRTRLSTRDRYEQTTTSVIVDQITPPRGEHPGYIHVHYAGFGHTVYLHEVVEARVTSPVRTYHEEA
jgi:hypothetical protein